MVVCNLSSAVATELKLTLCCSVNERTNMEFKIYLLEAWMCSEFGYHRPMLVLQGLRRRQIKTDTFRTAMLIRSI